MREHWHNIPGKKEIGILMSLGKFGRIAQVYVERVLEKPAQTVKPKKPPNNYTKDPVDDVRTS